MSGKCRLQTAVINGTHGQFLYLQDAAGCHARGHGQRGAQVRRLRGVLRVHGRPHAPV